MFETHDFISFKPKFIEVIEDHTTWRTITDPYLAPYFHALRSGPLTRRELKHKYMQISDTSISDQTFLKYLNKLLDLGLIRRAGQRQPSQKEEDRTLYARSAYLYYFMPMHLKEMEKEDRKRFAKLIKIFAETAIKKDLNSARCVEKAVLEVEKRLRTTIKRLNKLAMDEDLSYLLRDLPWSQIQHLINLTFGLALLANNKTLVRTFDRCFA